MVRIDGLNYHGLDHKIAIGSALVDCIHGWKIYQEWERARRAVRNSCLQRSQAFLPRSSTTTVRNLKHIRPASLLPLIIRPRLLHFIPHHVNYGSLKLPVLPEGRESPLLSPWIPLRSKSDRLQTRGRKWQEEPVPVPSALQGVEEHVSELFSVRGNHCSLCRFTIANATQHPMWVEG